MTAHDALLTAQKLLNEACEQLDNRSPFGVCYCSLKPAEQNVMAALAAVNQAITTLKGEQS